MKTDFLVWRDNWLLGIDELDVDHKEMVRLINRLARAEGDLIDNLDDLTAHLQGHFAREERFLEAIAYPEFATHAGDHAIQMAEFAVLRREIVSGERSDLDAGDLQSIKQWFFNHVIAEDRRFAVYYHREYLSRG